LSPDFEIKIYYTLDVTKARKQEIGIVRINLEDLLSGKEFMYEIEGCQDKAFLIIDRTQEINSAKGSM
jgi:hypothetical protein